MDMNIIAWVVVGLIAGALAKFLLPGDDPGGCIVTTLIGIVGAILGGFLSRTFLEYDPEGFSIGTIFVAIVGSIILLLVYRLVVGRRRR